MGKKLEQHEDHHCYLPPGKLVATIISPHPSCFSITFISVVSSLVSLYKLLYSLF